MAITIYSPAQQMTYGRPQYEQALGDWQTMMYGPESKKGVRTGGAGTQLQEMMKYYAPGGGYGQGLRQEAEQGIKGGVAQDLGSMVASGMSSQFGARGVQTRAQSELSKLYKNIEDTRNQLWQQSITPYAQMLQARPTYGEYFRTGEMLPESRQTF